MSVLSMFVTLGLSQKAINRRIRDYEVDKFHVGLGHSQKSETDKNDQQLLQTEMEIHFPAFSYSIPSETFDELSIQFP